MRIAQLAPLIERVPPKRYGGTERIVHYLTEELVKRGHSVTLFASGDSETKAKLVSSASHSLRSMYTSEEAAFTMLNVAKVYKRGEEFDIIHNHSDYYAFPAAYSSQTPTVTTFHGAFTLENKNIYDEYKDLNFVSISNSQRKGQPSLNWRSTIYHGIPVEKFPFKENHKDYLLFVGRISLEKGTHIAMDIAMSLDKELIMAAKLDKYDVDYFNKYVAPRLSNGKIRWVGEVDDKERNKLMAEASCLLHPVTWSEPFGLGMIEAMATGCPVIAFNKGSIPEIIIDKKTGFIVKEEKEMMKAIEKIGSISRKRCRAHVEKNFNLKGMVDSYEKLYYEIINGGPNKREPKSTAKERTRIPV
ncbi:MAG: glycosyltransferase family 4 protein [Candidatus Woykebacteria bacterium]